MRKDIRWITLKINGASNLRDPEALKLGTAGWYDWVRLSCGKTDTRASIAAGNARAADS